MRNELFIVNSYQTGLIISLYMARGTAHWQWNFDQQNPVTQGITTTS
jgi:hypothetical protein